jgi:hypothetical protein
LPIALLALGASCVSAIAWARVFHHTGGNSWTGISGMNGGYADEYLTPSSFGFYGIIGLEKSDDAVEFNIKTNSLTDTGDPTYGSWGVIKLDDGNPDSKKDADLGSDQYVTAVQVCVTNDKIKGVRIWGARLLEDGSLQPISQPGEYKRTNCKGNWKTKVSCPSGKIATGVRAYSVEVHKGYGGLALRCSTVE